MRVEFCRQNEQGEPGEVVASTTGMLIGKAILLDQPIITLRTGDYLLCVEGFEPTWYQVTASSEDLYRLPLSIVPRKEAA